MIKAYPEEVEQSMKEFLDSLSEKDKRRYAAVEAQKLGRSGITYVAKLLGCSGSTVHAGLKELGMLPEKKQDVRVRRKGGGRKNSEDRHAGLPIISMDTKKKEMLGNFYRDGNDLLVF